MPRFTDLYIRNLQPREKRYEVREAGGKGFAVRVGPNGVKTWVLMYDHNGARQKLTLGVYPDLSLADGRKASDAARGEIAKGNNPAADKQSARKEEKLARQRARLEATVSQLAERYLRLHAKPRKRSWGKDERMLNRDVLPSWGNRKAKEITRTDVIALLDDQLAAGKTAHVNRVLALVRKMFNFAIQKGIVEYNPCLGIQKPSEERPRHRALTKEELRAFWVKLDTAPMDDRIRRVLKLILLLGQRPGEVAGMRWEETSGDLWTIPAERHKSKKPHVVPLPKAAIELLGPRIESGPVFPCRTVVKGEESVRTFSVAKALDRCMEHLDIPKLTPHDLRRSAASLWSQAGIQRHLKPILLGHALPGVTDRHYDRHEYLPEKRHALEQWARWIEAVCAGNEGGELISFPSKAQG